MKSLLSPVVERRWSRSAPSIVLWKGTSLIVAGDDDGGRADGVPGLPYEILQAGKGSGEHDQRARPDDGRAWSASEKILAADDNHPRARWRHRSGPVKGAITLDHVAFGYGDDAEKCCMTSASASSRARSLGLSARPASGKSTVLSLIPASTIRSAGRVLIDGTDVSTYKLAALSVQVGFVLQETVLFHGTIRENIAYGRPGASDEEVVAAAKLANADEFISRMPHGYDSVVGERGDTLSGGQRQRIGIARAVIRNSPIMILDEPTAALDTESERLVIEGLERLMKGRTVIMIAHRLSTLRDADKIIVLKDGVVAEEGTNDELIARDGVYAELHRAQYETSPATPRAGRRLPGNGGKVKPHSR